MRPSLRILGLSFLVACGKSSSEPETMHFPDATASTHDAARKGTVDAKPPPSKQPEAAADVAKPPPRCDGSTHTQAAPAQGLPAPPAVTLASGLQIEIIASVNLARTLAPLPNGDLLVATRANDVYIVPNAEGTPGDPVLFASSSDAPVHGVAFDASTCTIAIGASHGIYTVPYVDGQTTATLGAPIALVRQGAEVHTATDTDTHTTTSVAFSGGKIYAGVGSSCNACTEVDPTRATVQEMAMDGSGMTSKATRFRNAIALTTNPVTGTVWAGGAGQDDLALGHPYEFFDAVTAHSGVADYGWPDCEEDDHAYVEGSNCTNVVVPRIELPAYSTIIGAVFYPSHPPKTGHELPEAYWGGLFLTAHGSWHQTSTGAYYSPPRVAFVAMNGDEPTSAVNWTSPTSQWVEVIGGFQLSDGVTRIGRPTGIGVGAQGSLFVSDDQTGEVYRIRPAQ